ncbi:MAG: DNA-3-methyladenine glycosylase 2 family protein [Candidatus Planktophila sp.]|nr:DNA-3-methyladenine glycosylase 2 family protein [Candidatus Planktophila sp.]
MTLHSAQKMRRIVCEVAESDKRFAPLIARRPLCTIGRNLRNETHLESLISSVISQQLATKAADTIHGRLVLACKGQITARKLIKLTDSDLRAIGVSGAKSRTIKGLAAAIVEKTIPIDRIDEIHDDQEIFEALTSLWGIGRWTVEMFMIFQLGRLDIWPTGDLAVRRGWDIVHKNHEESSAKALDLKGEKFHPHRSVVAWYCYQAVHESRGLAY